MQVPYTVLSVLFKMTILLFFISTVITKRKLLLLGVVFLSRICLFDLYLQGQNYGNEEFQNFTVKQGLNNSVVYSIIQDDDGFVWFATKDGLNKFDGYTMKSYSLSASSFQHARDNIVHCLAMHPEGNLFCGTSSGSIYYYEKNADKFTRFNITGPNPIISPIYFLSFADIDKLLICSASGLYYLNLNTSKVYLIGNLNQIVHSIFQDSKGEYWVGTATGVYRGNITLNSDNVKSDIVKEDYLGNFQVFTFHEDDKNQVWIGTRSKGLYVFQPTKNDYVDLNPALSKYFSELAHIRDICNTPDGKILVAIDGEGIWEINDDFTINKSYSHIEDDPNSLSNNSVYLLYYDIEDNLWIATYGGGVNFLYNEQKGFVRISHLPYNKNSLKNNTARAFLETFDKRLWFGTKEGISILDRFSNEWSHIGLNKPNEDEALILSMTQDSSGNIWIGSYNHGLISLNKKNLSYKKIDIKNSRGESIGTRNIYSVMVDRQGRIWSGGILGNMSVLDPKTMEAKEVAVVNVKSIYEFNSEKIYAGTTNGLFIVDSKTLEVERPKPANVLLNQNRFYCIYNDSILDPDHLWLGTEGGGLIRLNINSQSIKVFSVEDGLPSNFVYGIVPDKEGFLWLSTTKGISRFDFKNESFNNYNYSDGLTDQEFNFGAYGKTSHGEIVFGGQNGFTIIKPENLSSSESVPNIVFNSFKLFGKEQTVNSEDSPLTSHINTLNNIKLKYKQNSVSFGFSAVDFKNPEKILYKWKLKGFDNQWSEPAFSHEAIYTNLKPGDYVFQILASNFDGIWGDNLREIQIVITPPFWRTVWAYILYGLTFFGIFRLLLHYNHIRINEKHAVEKTRFFINIAHDLRTPLTLIKAPLELLSSNREINKKDAGSLLLARKNIDRLNRLVTQLMDFQKADLRKMQFTPNPYYFVEFVKDTASSFTPLIEEKKLNQQFNFPDEDFELWFDKNKMEKIVFNLLSNAIKYTPNEGDISLSIKQEKDHCTLIIKDSGIGIPLEQQKKIFTRYFRAKNVINSQESGSGVGLMLVKKLVELHKGEISFSSEECKGTVFTVKIPFKTYKEELLKEEATLKVTPDIFVRTDLSLTPEESLQDEKYKLLIVEDNHELMDFITSVLSSHFEVFKAYHGKAGLKLIKEKNPDLIISDIMMPVMDGNQMCQKIKSDIATCHIPVILLTALNTLEYKIEGLNVGADAYIEKPFDINFLLAQIKNLLNTRQRLKEKYAFHSSVPESEVTHNDLDNEFLLKAKSFVLNNLDNQELSVEMLAGELAMSRPVLYRKLKAITDQSPQDFIRLIRLQEAKKLLKQGKQNITEIAFETGFADPKYFSTSFKKLFGCTPTQFINQ